MISGGETRGSPWSHFGVTSCQYLRDGGGRPDVRSQEEDLRGASWTLCLCPPAELRDPLLKKKVERPPGLFVATPANGACGPWVHAKSPQSCLTACKPRDTARQASLSSPVSRSLLTLVSVESVMSVIQRRNKWEAAPKERRRNVLWSLG